jgi:hypothetical protein
MKNLIAALVVFTAVACAQEKGGTPQPKTVPPDAPEVSKPAAIVCRLESVTWNPVRGDLSWVVTIWDVENSIETPAAVERFVIHPDAAEMKYDQEVRSFDPDEARRVRMLMDLLSTYAVKSTVWWDRGGGADPEQLAPPVKDHDGNGSNPKGDGKQEAPKPAPAVLRAPVVPQTPVKPEHLAAAGH